MNIVTVTSWHPQLEGRAGPRYQALAEAIADAVGSGALPPGAKLPPMRDLAWKLGVTVGTVGRAYALAEQRRLVSGQVGRGTYVLDAETADPAMSGPGAADLPPTAGGTIDMTRNIPVIASQTAALADALGAMSRKPGLATLLNYMPDGGLPAYRAAGAAFIARVGLDLSPERIVLTGGAQHALAVAVLALSRPGDTVLTEQLSFAGVRNAVRLLGARPIGVAMDDEGALPQSIDRLARETGAKLVFLTPTIHSPTTSMMSRERRHAIAEMLRERGLILIEDDVYGFLPRERPEPIAALAPEHAIYVASVSKFLAPGLRLAWVAPPPRLRERLVETVHSTALALPAFSAEIVTRWIADGTAERLLDELRAEIAQRHQIARGALAGLSWRGRPDAMHAMIDLPAGWRAGEFVDAARLSRIAVCPAEAFAIDPSTAPNAIRVTLGATADRATLERALKAIAGLAASPSSDPAEQARRRIV